MSLIESCMDELCTVVRNSVAYHSKWIPTIGWKHIAFCVSKKEYDEGIATKVFKKLSASTMYANMEFCVPYQWYYVKTGIDKNRQAVKKTVNIFYIKNQMKVSHTLKMMLNCGRRGMTITHIGSKPEKLLQHVQFFQIL